MQSGKMIQVSFDLSHITEEEDKLIALLGEAGCDSFWQDENVLHAFFNENILAEIDLKNLLTENFKQNIPSFEVLETEEKNWNEEWEKNYEPTVVGGQIYIYAPFHEKIETYPYSILIEPKMSFGTAHHGTTASMLAFLLDEDLTNKSVIDAGCGTGVLAIFATMRGATNVFAYDNDPWSVENASENFARNTDLDIKIELGESELLKGRTCDVFLANIHKNVIIKEIPDYAKTLKPGGLLFLSGFYEKDLKDISCVCNENGLLFEKFREMDGWIAAKFVKEGL